MYIMYYKPLPRLKSLLRDNRKKQTNPKTKRRKSKEKEENKEPEVRKRDPKREVELRALSDLLLIPRTFTHIIINVKI